MKVIQSFWSKPAFHTDQNFFNARKIGGWPDFRDFLISASYSCLTLQRHHKEIELYTDSAGKGILIDLLKLPYDNVSLTLNELENEDHKLWILGKMRAIKLQNKPFIHVDNDIFVWDGTPSNTDPRYLVGQSTYPVPEEYKRSLSEVLNTFTYIPECLKEVPDNTSEVINVGVVGGNDIDFFQEFCEVSSNLLERNRQHIGQINIGGFNQIMEEYLFSRLVKYNKRSVQHVFESSPGTLFHAFVRINMAPIVYKYIHIIGRYKQNQYGCEQLGLRLKYEFPDQYKIVEELINDRYPELNSDREFCCERRNKLLKAIHILYTHTLQQVLNMKIVLCRGIEIIDVGDFLTRHREYIVKESDQKTGQVKYKVIPPSFSDDMNQYLKYFSSPISISEVLEDIKGEDGQLSGMDIQVLRFKLIDVVTWNTLVVGILEFVES